MAAFLGNSYRVYACTVPNPVPPYFYYVLIFIITLCVLIQAYRYIHEDYHAFLSLGPGGTPSTFQGYLRISWLRLYAHKNPFLPPVLTPEILPSCGYLLRLPRRPGSRPRVAGIAPHRQTDQRPPRALSEGMVGALHLLADANPAWIRTGVSSFEKHGLALFLTSTVALQHLSASHLNETCRDTGEICHLHPTDTSMHLTLHPHDAALVISHGWGERHPLAGRSIMGKILLPAGFVMVYAPTSASQTAILMDIVRAAAWWVGGVGLSDGGRRGVGVLTRGEGENLL